MSSQNKATDGDGDVAGNETANADYDYVANDAHDENKGNALDTLPAANNSNVQAAPHIKQSRPEAAPCQGQDGPMLMGQYQISICRG